MADLGDGQARWQEFACPGMPLNRLGREDALWQVENDGWQRKQALLLGPAGDDLILNLVVSGFRKNAARDKLVLRSVGAAVDDAFGVGVADAGEGLELVGCGGVDVELAGNSGGGFGLGDGVRRREDRNGDDQKREGEKFVAQGVHG